MHEMQSDLIYTLILLFFRQICISVCKYSKWESPNKNSELK